MTGNRLGARGRFGYTDDLGNAYALVTDVSLADAAGLVAPAAGAPRIPVRFKPRGVYVESVGTPKARKFLPVAAPTATIYASNAPQTIQIDGENFVTTGRRGETLSF